MYEYEMQYIENEHNRQFNSTEAWIYIGIDTDRMGMFKLGLTSGELRTRDTSSQNPFYTLLVGFKVKVGISNSEIREIEKAVLTAVSRICQPIYHYNSGNRSEWFYGNPYEIRDFVNYFLYENYSHKMNCYYCSIRQQGIVYGWENEHFLHGKSRNRYQVNDISNPPPDPDCFNYGGCGDDQCEECGDLWHLKNR